MGEIEQDDVLFTLSEHDDFEDLLADHLEAVERAPDDFDAGQLNGPLEDSEWAGQEGACPLYQTGGSETVGEALPEHAFIEGNGTGRRISRPSGVFLDRE